MNNLSDFMANQFLVHEMDIYILYRLSINVTTDSRSELHTSNKVNKNILLISKHKKVIKKKINVYLFI